MKTDDDVVQYISDEELDALVSGVLADCGVTIQELRGQAELGRFDSEKNRRAWFAISGFGRG